MTAVEFSHEITRELARTATQRWFRHHLGLRVPLYLLGVLAGSALLLAMGSRLLAAVFFGAWIVLIVVFAAIYVVRMRRSAWVLDQLADRTSHYRITDDGFEIGSELGNSIFRWSMVTKVVRFPEVWLIYVGTQPFWIPAAPLAGPAGELILERAAQAGAKAV